jgi:hypothetical protein
MNRKKIAAVAWASCATILMAFVYFYLSHKGRMPVSVSDLCYWIWDTWAFLPLAVLCVLIWRLSWPRSRKSA